jgi:excisionase family DNA binding protein
LAPTVPRPAHHAGGAVTEPRPRQYVTLGAAAERLGCSQRTVRRMVSRGELHAYRVGQRMLRLDSDELDALARVVPTVGTVA